MYLHDLLLRSIWRPSKILFHKTVKYFIVRSIELLEKVVSFLFDLGLWSSLGLVEAFLPGALPLTVGQGQLLLPTIKPLAEKFYHTNNGLRCMNIYFGWVEEEIVLCYLWGNIKELLQLSNLFPGFFDEFISINYMYLFQRKMSYPSETLKLKARISPIY